MNKSKKNLEALTINDTVNTSPIIDLKCHDITLNDNTCIINLNVTDIKVREHALSAVVKAHAKHGRDILQFNLNDGKGIAMVRGWIVNYSPWTVVLKLEEVDQETVNI